MVTRMAREEAAAEYARLQKENPMVAATFRIDNYALLAPQPEAAPPPSKPAEGTALADARANELRAQAAAILHPIERARFKLEHAGELYPDWDRK